jgi:hypothetical protein
MRVYYLCQTGMIKRIFALCFWLFVNQIKGHPEGPARECRLKMEEVLKKKMFELLLLLNNPKDEIMQVLPFIIAQGIMIAFDEKIIEPLKQILGQPHLPKSKQYSTESQVGAFVFNLMNPSAPLLEPAVSKLIVNILDSNRPLTRNQKILFELEKFLNLPKPRESVIEVPNQLKTRPFPLQTSADLKFPSLQSPS